MERGYICEKKLAGWTFDTAMINSPEIETLVIRLSTPFYVFLIGFELILSNWRNQSAYTWKDTGVNALFMLLNGGIDLLFRATYIGILLWFFDTGSGVVSAIEQAWLYWLLLFIAEDLIFYLLHYIDHHSRLFWAVHVTHHSSEHFNLTTGFRSSVFQPLYRFIYFIPLVFLGFHPTDIVVMYSVTQIYGILVHTALVGKLGWLEKILVTPSHHRVHHASNVEYLDKNMGMCLIVWDKIFGTFQEELEEVRPKYGLTTPLDSPSIPHTIFHEWKQMKRDLNQSLPLLVKIKYIFFPPGWSHTGGGNSTRELRKKQKEVNQR